DPPRPTTFPPFAQPPPSPLLAHEGHMGPPAGRPSCRPVRPGAPAPRASRASRASRAREGATGWAARAIPETVENANRGARGGQGPSPLPDAPFYIYGSGPAEAVSCFRLRLPCHDSRIPFSV